MIIGNTFHPRHRLIQTLFRSDHDSQTPQRGVPRAAGSRPSGAAAYLPPNPSPQVYGQCR